MSLIKTNFHPKFTSSMTMLSHRCLRTHNTPNLLFERLAWVSSNIRSSIDQHSSSGSLWMSLEKLPRSHYTPYDTQRHIFSVGVAMTLESLSFHQIHSFIKSAPPTHIPLVRIPMWFHLERTHMRPFGGACSMHGDLPSTQYEQQILNLRTLSRKGQGLLSRVLVRAHNTPSLIA